MTTLDKALTIAAELGLPVFPCRDSDKRPTTDHGFQDAAKDPAMIRDMFCHRPGELIGVPTGAVSGFDVLDIDLRHAGDLWLMQHKDRIPATRSHRTRSGGWHFLFRCDARLRNSASRIAPGVDTRCNGGYCIWWPALGLPIEYPDRLAPWPDWLLAELLPAMTPHAFQSTPLTISDRYVRRAIERGCERIANAPEGRRNITLNNEAFALARFVVAGAIGSQDLAGALADAAIAIALPPREIANTLASAFRARGIV